MWFKNREYFLGVRDGFTVNETPLCLVDLACRMAHVAFDFNLACHIMLGREAVLLQLRERGLCPTQILLGNIQNECLGLCDTGRSEPIYVRLN